MNQEKFSYTFSRLKQLVKEYPRRTALFSAVLFAVLAVFSYALITADIDRNNQWRIEASINREYENLRNEQDLLQLFEEMTDGEKAGRYYMLSLLREQGEIRLSNLITDGEQWWNADDIMREEDLVQLAETVSSGEYVSGLRRIYAGFDGEDTIAGIRVLYTSFGTHSQTVPSVNPYTHEQEDYLNIASQQEIFKTDFTDTEIVSFREISLEFPYLSAGFNAWKKWHDISHQNPLKEWHLSRTVNMSSGTLQIIETASPLKETAGLMFRIAVLAAVILLIYGFAGWTMERSRSERAVLKEIRRDSINAIAHEMRTPLSSIAGYAEMLKMGVKEEKKDVYLERILEKSREMDGMINDMISLAKLDESDVSLIREEVQMNDLVHEICESYQDTDFLFEESGTMKVMADISYMKRMLKCLIDNAVRYRNKNTRVQVYISHHELKIHNECEPITSEEMNDLFRLRQREDGHFSFGLYFSKKAAEKNNMKLHVYNEKDGVTVSVLS
ncbi:MAG TPA: hypothetical protein DHW39_05585 [Erysipelotrichaceae bacterium]|nr:hypothetical protein [Erysipelotrichaceae bacterium]